MFQRHRLPIDPIQQEAAQDERNNIQADKVLVDASKILERNTIRFDDPDV
jgi:hypothetical protein